MTRSLSPSERSAIPQFIDGIRVITEEREEVTDVPPEVLAALQQQEAEEDEGEEEESDEDGR